MIAILISVTVSAVSGMALFFMQRYLKSRTEKDAEYDLLKRKENVLILRNIDALGKLTYANAIAIRDGKTNGEMHEAMNGYLEVKDEMYEYLLEQNSKK